MKLIIKQALIAGRVRRCTMGSEMRRKALTHINKKRKEKGGTLERKG